MSRRQNRPQYDNKKAIEEQFGFLMNKNYSNTGGRYGANKRANEKVTTGNTGQNFLSNFIYGKDNQRKGKLNVFGINVPDFGVTEAFSGAGQQVADAFKRQETADPNQTQLGSPFDRQQYNRDFRNMLITDSLLRRGEMAAERRGNLEMMKQTLPLVDMYAETAAQRRLMEDKFSPTKISQQRLRAQQGEAALMNAIANQGTTAAQIGSIGTSRRYGR